MTSPPVLAPDAAGLARAVEALRAGHLVGMPTETVYGLAANAADAGAVARVFAAKGRPRFNPLIAHAADLEAACAEGTLDRRALALADAFWPGALTLVVPARERGRVCELARAGLATLALRVPAHPAARALLRDFGGPLAAPSANPSGRLSPTCAGDVASELADAVALVIDGGPATFGIESTIVAVLPDEPLRLLRPGAIARERIEQVAGPLAETRHDAISAPGQLQSHYAPRARLRLNAAFAEPGEVLLGFGASAPVDALNLSRAGDVTEAAANLFTMLRALDATGTATIAVMPVPADGLGEAINDRLQRAAAPRGA